MVDLSIAEGKLTLHVRGADKLWALKSSLEIPLVHIAGVRPDAEVARGWYHGIRMPGTHVPGVITAGTFYQDGRRVFWDVHHPEKTIVIELHDERYNQSVVEVANPEEAVILQDAIAANPTDAKAAYYLGHFLRDRRRHREAIQLWERSAQIDPSFFVVWRNLGIAYFNVLGRTDKARSAFDKAIQINLNDACVFYERDQLWKRIGETPENRLKEFNRFAALVPQRDDLSVELVSLFNQAGEHEKALALLQSRKFQPWEGGEGLVLRQHVRTHLALGRRALLAGDAIGARCLFEAALSCPENLGEATHPLANQSDIFYWLGVANEAAGEFAAARTWWERAAKHKGDFQGNSMKAVSEATYYTALALKRLGRTTEAYQLLHDLLRYGDELEQQPVKIDYFATSLPAMLLFDDDIQKRNIVTATFLQAQARMGLGEMARARQLLSKVLLLDRNHALAADLLTEVEATPADLENRGDS